MVSYGQNPASLDERVLLPGQAYPAIADDLIFQP